MKNFLLNAAVFISLLSAGAVIAQSEKSDPNSVFGGKKLANGTLIVPDSSINGNEFRKQYKANKALWDKAIAYLTQANLDDMAPGKYAILPDSSVYAIVSINITKPADQLKWESHRKYIDVQCVISGAEQMQKAPLNALTVTKPYDAAKDLANYDGNGILHLATAGRVLIFFPEDGHRPAIKADGFDKDKKIVIKVLFAD